MNEREMLDKLDALTTAIIGTLPMDGNSDKIQLACELQQYAKDRRYQMEHPDSYEVEVRGRKQG